VVNSHVPFKLKREQVDKMLEEKSTEKGEDGLNKNKNKKSGNN
jgi:hypothetical protein